MRKLGAVAVLLAMSACSGEPEYYVPPDAGVEQGPPKERIITARIKNEYAVSLFSLTIAVNGKSRILLTDERVESNASGYAEFLATTGDEVGFTFSSMSLGDRFRFNPVTLKTPLGKETDTLTIVYDYDLATAAFQISYGWGP